MHTFVKSLGPIVIYSFKQTTTRLEAESGMTFCTKNDTADTPKQARRREENIAWLKEYDNKYLIS